MNESPEMKAAIQRIMQELGTSEDDARDLMQTFTRKRWGLEQGIRTTKLATKLATMKPKREKI